MTSSHSTEERVVDWYPRSDHFEMLGSTLGDHGIVITIGSLTMKIDGLTPRIKQAAKKQYDPFLVDNQSPDFLITIYPGRRSYLGMAPDGYLRLDEKELKKGRLLVSHDFAAYTSGSSCILRVSNPEDEKAALRAIENCIRWTVADHAIQNGGFVLHAAGLVRDGNAYVFFGPSGAGKSTTTELSGDVQILSDDLVLIREIDTGWVAATTPFAGSFPQETKTRGEYPLKGLYRLIKDDTDFLSRLPSGLAVGKVLSCCPFVGNQSKRRDFLLPRVEDCCSKVPAHDLHFRKTPSFWKLILETDND